MSHAEASVSNFILVKVKEKISLQFSFSRKSKLSPVVWGLKYHILPAQFAELVKAHLKEMRLGDQEVKGKLTNFLNDQRQKRKLQQQVI